MPIAAVPEYLGNDFKSASPALRFGMYLKLWGVDWKKPNDKRPALGDAISLNSSDRNAMNAFTHRQRALFEQTGANGLQLMSTSIAPFTTGLGNEHPLENGFAFINPYGLPYLPGSGVKGVLRRSAEELAHEAFFKDGHWTLPAIWHLFGFEERGLHVRGALQFWDVMPQTKSDRLAVEIMTPHYSHYYKEREHGGGESPHDSGGPNSILFLTVPPDSSFTFHVVCDQQRLERTAPELAEDGAWKKLLKRAFEHAFDWLGFGAKTAVGYGAMKRDRAGEERAQEEQGERERIERERDKRAQAEKKIKEQEEERLAKLTPTEREIDAVIRDRQDKNMTDIAAVIRAARDGRWDGDMKMEVAKWLENKMREEKCWRETSAKKRPDRDKDYQNTLTIKGWLEGK